MDNKNNSGHYNSGNWNSGNWNSGYRNSSNYNSGNYNSGNWNSGNWNSGDYNSGDYNSGYFNSGYFNSGYFNIDEPKVRIFGKETDIKRNDINFPDFFYFDLNTWVSEEDMTAKEKEAHPSYVTTGGYLKLRGYKQAWRESWDNADLKDRKKVFDLPNWNNDIFKEITGIDAEKELNSKKSVDDVLAKLSDEDKEIIKQALNKNQS